MPFDSASQFLTLHITLISGFRVAKTGFSGVVDLARKLNIAYGAPTVRVVVTPWDYDFDKAARIIDRDCLPQCAQVAIGHSFGCGRGVIELAENLRQHGDRWLNQVHAIDPVVRRFKWVRALNVTSLTRWWPWECPRNVDELWPYRQCNKRDWKDPVGRVCVPMNAATQCMPEMLFGSQANLDQWRGDSKSIEFVDDACFHDTIDNDERVHRRVVEQVGRLTERNPFWPRP